MVMQLPLPNAFQWDTIDSENQIRLLSIRTTKIKTPPTECTVSTFYRSSLPPYEALSYTWGSNIRDAIINCNEQPLRVTKNCESALRALRQRRSVGLSDEHSQPLEYVWIDAICINQQNTAERNVQVSLMGEVFRHAQRTVVYLGDIDHHATWMMEKIFCDGAVKIPVHLEEALKRHWDAFFGRPWFTRTWVVQEVMSSSALIVLVGFGEIPWTSIERSGEKLRQIRAARRVGQTTLNRLHVPALVGMREVLAGALQTSDGEGIPSGVKGRSSRSNIHTLGYENSEIVDGTPLLPVRMRLPYSRLMNVLRMTYSFNCKDPRDKLFALLSLFQTPIPAELVPDYAKSVIEVYQNLSWYLIRNNNHEAVLFSRARNRPRDMPSWAMDWRYDILLEASRLKLDMVASDPDEWTAGLWKGRRQIYAERDKNFLVVKGVLMDNLRRLPGERDLHGSQFEYVYGPGNAEQGDSICILLGFPAPFVLRRVDADNWYLVGDCFVEGLMLGEALNGLNSFQESTDLCVDVPTSPLRNFRIC